MYGKDVSAVNGTMGPFLCYKDSTDLYSIRAYHIYGLSSKGTKSKKCKDHSRNDGETVTFNRVLYIYIYEYKPYRPHTDDKRENKQRNEHDPLTPKGVTPLKAQKRNDKKRVNTKHTIE